ncbi:MULTISPECIES: C40 family peptidase [unclassified Rhizobium]|uniref:CHAP domain-containing protein n=1 Tax=unclassified Rhizobium TaxID=2613769 RepID=UPI001ADA8DAD|nr:MULTISPECIES: CHAP domain-containing protein [unclassified Rhizobium]MBO9127942.1 CHAP domain-containing protein [Rhizobium sp. 16-488-2b]MBO9178519.1 CHAP domain-containing protein [Rhizobium sp. 16-488-2a]
MISRRGFIVSTPVLALSLQASAQEAPNLDPLSNFRPPTPEMESVTSPTGDNATRGEDIAKAFRLMLKAPQNKAPIDVANYYSELPDLSATDVKDNATGKSMKRLYREEWPVSGAANPMIVNFFAFTQLLPSGDQVAWCAAFLNYTLWVSGKRGTDSAASASFRKLVKAGHSPKTGDVAVFKRNGGNGDAPNYQGHVAYYVDPKDVDAQKYKAHPSVIEKFKAGGGSYIYCLGGNQASPGSTGGVKVAAIETDGYHKLLGYAPISSLKEI